MRINILLILISFLFVACSSTRIVESKNESPQRSNLSEKQEVAFGRLYLEATKEKLLENFESAADLYVKALQIDKYSASAHYELGIVYSQLGKDQEAFQEFQTASNLEPNNYWYKLSYATFLESKGELEKAIEQFKELAIINPSQIELKYELAKLLVTVNREREGIEYLDRIEDEIGITEEISFLKQRIYLAINDLDGALGEIQALIDYYPKDLKYYSILADLYLSNDKREEALKVYSLMQSIDSTNYQVQFTLAEFYRAEPNHELYLKNIRKAFANEEMDIDMKIKFLLSVYSPTSQNKELTREAIELGKIIADTHPNNAKSYAVYGDYLYFDNQVQQAKNAYIKTISIDSSRFAVWNQLLFIFSEIQDNDAIIEYGKRAIDLFPNQPSLYLLYGIGLASNKNHEKAIDYYKLGIDLVIDNQALKSQFYSSTGDSYHELDDNKNSDIFYEKALSIDPNNVYVLNNFSYYLSLRKENLEKAKAMSLKSNQISPNQPSFEDTYSWILFQLEEYDLALEWINKAINNSEDPSEVLLEHKGDILFKLEKVEEAIEFWNNALEKIPNSEVLKRKIENKTTDE